MVVYLCYDCSYNGCDEWKTVVKVVATELQAIEWVTEVEEKEHEWREYVDKTVEESK